jgi:hypothetical protein
VDRRVFHESGGWQAPDRRDEALSWPVCDEELDEIEGVEDWATYAAAPNATWRDRADRAELLEPVTGPRDPLSIAPRELRNYLAAQNWARRSRRRRIGGVAALVALACVVALIMLLQFRGTVSVSAATDTSSTLTSVRQKSPVR